MHLSDMEIDPADDRRILRTGDGSLTVVVGADGPTYHSRAGALTESRHVFIAAGLAAVAADCDPVDVFEVGFGTGLNAALAWQWARTTGRRVRYRACEPFPLPPALAAELAAAYSPDVGLSEPELAALHACTAAPPHLLSPEFSAAIEVLPFAACSLAPESVDVLFHDAFAPDTAPELWTDEVYTAMLQALRPGGLLVTYCAKGAVRRALEAAGFATERLPGPPGKREMLRARKVPLERFNIRVYGFVLDPTECYVLLVSELLPGGRRTKFPGGGLELGEGPEDALLRELREELGTDVRPDPTFGLRHRYTTGFFQRSIFRPSDQILSIYYTLRLPADTPIPLPPAEFPGAEPGLTFRWHPLATLHPDLLDFPIDKVVAQGS